MSNNDYWAYLRESRENTLKHYRLGGERSGYSKYSWYKPVGEKAKEALKTAGNYISTTVSNIGSNIQKKLHNAKVKIRNNIAESKRTSYGDMKNNTAVYKFDNDKYYDSRIKNPYNTSGSAPMGKEDFRQTRNFNVDQFLKAKETAEEVDKILRYHWNDIKSSDSKDIAEGMTTPIAWQLCKKYGIPYTDEFENKIAPLVLTRIRMMNAPDVKSDDRIKLNKYNSGSVSDVKPRNLVADAKQRQRDREIQKNAEEYLTNTIKTLYSNQHGTINFSTDEKNRLAEKNIIMGLQLMLGYTPSQKTIEEYKNYYKKNPIFKG